MLSITFLARTSFILFAPLFLIYFFYRYFKDRSVKPTHLLFVLLPGIVIVGSYLAWNYYLTGHLQQISVLAKSFEYGGAFL